VIWDGGIPFFSWCSYVYFQSSVLLELMLILLLKP